MGARRRWREHDSGVTGNVTRRVADFVEAIGPDLAEGAIVAATMHFHAMSLAAVVLAIDEAQAAQLQPAPGHVPAAMMATVSTLSRRVTKAFTEQLTRRIAGTTRKAPGAVAALLRDRNR